MVPTFKTSPQARGLPQCLPLARPAWLPGGTAREAGALPGPSPGGPDLLPGDASEARPGRPVAPHGSSSPDRANQSPGSRAGAAPGAAGGADARPRGRCPPRAVLNARPRSAPARPRSRVPRGGGGEGRRAPAGAAAPLGLGEGAGRAAGARPGEPGAAWGCGATIMVKRKSSEGQEQDGGRGVPLPIQTFLWRQTR